MVLSFFLVSYFNWLFVYCLHTDWLSIYMCDFLLVVALLSVNLSTVAAQYINAQKIRCDQNFLEAMVQEHNQFSKSLQEAKQVLLNAHAQYQTMITRAKDVQVLSLFFAFMGLV